MSMPLIVPGLFGSCERHWQTWLERRLPLAQRVDPQSTSPDLERWSAAVGEAIIEQFQPTLLIAHGFGCLAAAVSSVTLASRISGALLVAPSDPRRFGLGGEALDRPLPFPSILVASRNDPRMSFPSAAEWASRWGSRLIDVGHQGHIDVASGHGPWPEALTLIAELSGSADVRVLRRAGPLALEQAV